jgi:uncharacterized membrane protein
LDLKKTADSKNSSGHSSSNMTYYDFSWTSEFKKISISFGISVIAFQIMYYLTPFFVTLRTVFSIFWLFVLPGMSFLLHYRHKLHFVERFVISVPVSIAIVGTFSYYLGLFGLHAKYHGWILPEITIGLGFLFQYFADSFEKRMTKKKNQ